MQNFMFSELKELYTRIKNYPSDKTAGGEKIADTILDLVECSIHARKEGLLSIEESLDLEDINDPISSYKVAVFNLVLDGTSPELVQKAGIFRYLSDGDENPFDALCKLIILTAALAIQDSENPRLIETQLIMMVPAQIRFLCVKKFDDILPVTAPKSYKDLITVHFEEASASSPSQSRSDEDSDFSDFFEPVLMELSDTEIQLLLRETEDVDLRAALSGVGRKAAEHLFHNMPERKGRIILEEMDQADMTPFVTVQNSRRKLLSILCELSDAGEIRVDLDSCRNFSQLLDLYHSP